MFEYIKSAGLVFSSLQKRYSTTKIILHHTATASASMQSMHQYHISKGMNGLAYNIVVYKDGTTYWGRGLDMVGGHTSDTSVNKVSVGLCAVGNFETETMGDVQKEAIKRVIRDLLKYYPTITEILGHKQVTSTDCPGKNYPLAEMAALLKESNTSTGGTVNTGGSTSSTLIKEGQKGDKVTQLQQQLKIIGYDPGTVDGDFGPKTKAAVVAFQTAMGVEADGIVGPITREAINQVIAKPTTKNGSKGYPVRQLQTLLKRKGFDPGTVDGIFGNNTEAAVKKFQTAKKIGVDGIVGKQTWGALYN